MRILVIGQVYPWPATFGGRMRLATTIDALGSLGIVDLFVAPRDRNSQRAEPKARTIRRLCLCEFPQSRLPLVERLAWFARPELPLELAGRDMSELRRTFATFVEGQEYDLVWVSRLESYVAFASFLNAPTIVDLDNLEDDWYASRLSASENDNRHGGVVGRLKRVQAKLNVSRWKKLQDKAAGSVQATVVCSHADLRRLGASNAVVVPNGYERPLRPLGRVAVGDPPTVMLQGALWYGPNMDAARYLVERVGPALRERVPDVRIRLVGRLGPTGEMFGDHPGVETTGWVPEMEPELGRADVVAAPIRFGGGTRIKILEAFAHRIPVVSTSLGAHGLDAVDGQHLLLAETSIEFAEACAQLLTDEARRQALADEAEDLFLKRYERSIVQSAIRDLARSVA